MAFDATKLIVGKKYLSRDGRSARYLGEIKGHFSRAFAFQDGDSEMVEATTESGSYLGGNESGRDIISDEPIKEPVKLTLAGGRFFAVYQSSSGPRLDAGSNTLDEAIRHAKAFKNNAIGVYELPAEIEVTPV